MIEYRSMSAKAKESVRKMLEAISEEDTTAFEDFPEILKTPKVCLAAVMKNGYVIESVPASLITPELCIATVKQNGYAIGVIPKTFITPELCFLAVENDTGDSILENIPSEFLTQELCLYAVKKCGYLLRYVPFDELTVEVCTAAVLNNDYALKFVPKFHLKEVHAALESFQKGIEENRLKTARAMHAEGDSHAKISRVTEIPLKTLKKRSCLSKKEEKQYARIHGHNEMG